MSEVKKIAKIEVIKEGSPPDVDSDFNTEIRDLIYEHVGELYGHDKVCSVITFGKMAAKNAFKTMCTIYEVPFATANKIAALVPKPIEGVEMTLEDIYNPESARYAEADEFRAAVSGSEWKKIMEGALATEGRYKSTGMHAAGVIISAQDISDVVPLQIRQDDGRVITQWSYPECEKIGLIKFDFLGLDTVDLIQRTVEYIGKSGKEQPNMLEIMHGPMDQVKTYEVFQRGDTTGVFQFGSSLVRDFCKLMKPDSFNDLVATTALLRPGPMGMNSHVKYANRKNGREKMEYIHDEFRGTVLEEILGNTYGLVVFQEQILQIANQIGGMTLTEGDALRKAMGKKKKELMATMQEKFVSGGIKNGYSEEALNALWDTMAEFARYGFNQCLYGRSLVRLSTGEKVRIEDLYTRFEAGEDIAIEAMYEDGEIRPHKVANVVKSGRKPLYTVKTKSGRSLRITEDHRLLTTSGYGTIKDGSIVIGAELMIDEEWTKKISQKALIARQGNMTKLNKSDAQRDKARVRMTEYQATLSFEERSKHQKYVQQIHPDRHEKSIAAAHVELKRLYAEDEEWQSNRLTQAREQWEAGKIAGARGFGKPTQMSDGRWCDSICEALAGNYLLDRKVEFELHKNVVSPQGRVKVCDFYANGIYFEMDGLGRGREYFVEHKYGKDTPFVYLTPDNYIDEIDAALMRHNIKNGDPIVAIIAPKRLNSGKSLNEMTYDIEMESTGPSNFIANGLVSHNSHSVAYGITAYECAYLKANYPVEFMSALIAQNVGKKDKILAFLKESRTMGIKMGSVDINLSDVLVAPDFTGESGFDILYGLSGVDAVSKDVASIIVQERRDNGPYASVQNMVHRCMPLGISNRRVYENLALAGAFDCFNAPRRGVVDNIAAMLTEGKTKAKKGESLFDMFSGGGESDEVDVMEIDLMGSPEFPFVEKLQREANVIGLYLTNHPLRNVGIGLGQGSVLPLSRVMQMTQNTQVNIVGSVTDIEEKNGRMGKSIKLTIDDGSHYIEANLQRDLVKGIAKKNAQERAFKLFTNGETSISPDILAAASNPEFIAIDSLEKNNIYLFNINYRPAYGEAPAGARINSVRPLRLSDEGLLPIRLRVKARDGMEEQLRAKVVKFAELVSKKHPGDYPIYAGIFTEDDTQRVVNDGDYFSELQEIMREPVQGVISSRSKGKVRELPPFHGKRTVTITEQELADNLEYFDTGFRAAKSSEVEELLASKFGGERVDFGVFNDIMNDTES